MYIEGTSFDTIQTIRDQVLNATVEDIQALAEPIQKMLSQGVICVVGNEGRIEDAKDLFHTVRALTELQNYRITELQNKE